MAKQAGQSHINIKDMHEHCSPAALSSLTHIFICPLFLKDLENALDCLQREDPSLKVRVDPDSGQVTFII